MIATMSAKPYDFPYTEANQTTSADFSCAPIYSNAPEYMPWTTSSYEYPSMSVVSGVESSTWSSLPPMSHDDPSMFTSTAGLEWTGYDTMPECQHNGWTPSVNPNSAVSMPDGGMWGSQGYQNASVSPYSDAAAPSDRRTPFSQSGVPGSTNNAANYISSARIPPDSGASPPAFYQAPDVATTSSFASTSKHASKQKASERKPKPTSSKRKASSSGASSATPPSRQPPQLKPSKPKLTTPTAANSVSTSEQQYQAQLLTRYGSSIPPLTAADSKDPRAAADHIRREAWRICKAEALEMSQRRVKLLEHEQGALERETRQLQVNIGLMREAIHKEHEELKEAVGRAERLERGDC